MHFTCVVITTTGTKRINTADVRSFAELVLLHDRAEVTHHFSKLVARVNYDNRTWA